MKAMKAGDYPNHILNKYFPNHCCHKGGKPKFGLMNVGTMKNPKMVGYIMNRKQRRNEA